MIFGAAYRPAGPFLSVLIVSYGAYSVYITLVTALLAENRPRRALAIPLALLPVAAVAIWLGVRWLGPIGAAWASLLCVGGAATIVAVYVLRRYRPAVDLGPGPLVSPHRPGLGGGGRTCLGVVAVRAVAGDGLCAAGRAVPGPAAGPTGAADRGPETGRHVVGPAENGTQMNADRTARRRKIWRVSIGFIPACLTLGMLFYLAGVSSRAMAAEDADSNWRMGHTLTKQPGGIQTAMAVTTLEDELNTDGDCSLREALEAANTNTPVDACGAGDVLTDTITFGVAGTITVTSQLSVTAGGPLVVDRGRGDHSHWRRSDPRVVGANGQRSDPAEPGGDRWKCVLWRWVIRRLVGKGDHHQ